MEATPFSRRTNTRPNVQCFHVRPNDGARTHGNNISLTRNLSCRLVTGQGSSRRNCLGHFLSSDHPCPRTVSLAADIESSAKCPSETFVESKRKLRDFGKMGSGLKPVIKRAATRISCSLWGEYELMISFAIFAPTAPKNWSREHSVHQLGFVGFLQIIFSNHNAHRESCLRQS